MVEHGENGTNVISAGGKCIYLLMSFVKVKVECKAHSLLGLISYKIYLNSMNIVYMDCIVDICTHTGGVSGLGEIYILVITGIALEFDFNVIKEPAAPTSPGCGIDAQSQL
jgi:hypothetical protein